MAYLATSRLPSGEANSIHVMRMAQAMTAAGCAVLLVARPGDAQLGEPHAHYGTSGFDLELVADPRLKGWRPWGRALRARRAVADWNGNVAYGRDPHALLLTARQGLPVGFEVHELSGGRRHRLEARLFSHPRLRLVTFITEALQQDYLAVHPGLVSVDRLVAPDGADRVPRSSVRTFDRPRIGYVGHLYEGRGIEVMIELAARIPSADFEVVGGTDADVLRHRTAAAHHRNLRFLGAQPPHAVGSFIATFDIVLAPYQVGLRTARGGDTSRWMSPLKIFEYMAHGRAIVASSLPALREILTDGVNAVLVEPTHVDGWEHAVRRLLLEPSLRTALGDRARADLEARYTWEARARTIIDRMAVP